MKKHIILFSLFSFSLALGSCSKKQETAATDSTANVTTTAAPASTTQPVTAGKYKLKSAIVTSTMEMPSLKQHSTEVLYFDNYGAQEAKETTGDIMGIKMHTLTFSKDGYTYHIDLENKTGTRTKGGVVSADMDYSHLTPKLEAEYNIKKEGTEEVAGKTCDVYSMDSKMMKGRVSSWQGIPMHMDAAVSGMQMKSTVTSIEENAAIPADKFEVPAGITVKEM